jgi:hypothetical protein
MKLTKNSLLVLDLRDLTQDVSIVITKFIVNELNDIGFKTKTVPHASTLLYLGLPWNWKEVSHGGDDHTIEYWRQKKGADNTKVYNAHDANALTEFLVAAKAFYNCNQTQEANIRGVNVTITRENITMDATDLLKRVELEAKELQRSCFP